jgi:molybdopterin molybdotransferase
MISLDTAHELIKDSLPVKRIMPIAVEKSMGYVSAGDIFADGSLPHFPSSAVDGFAVITSGVTPAHRNGPVRLNIVGRLAAGHTIEYALNEGETIQVMTGAPVPPGADAVIMKEKVSSIDDYISVNAPVAPKENIRSPGEDVKEGDLILRKGTLIRPTNIALLAACGITEIDVVRKPTVTILTTGDELLPMNVSLQYGKIRDSNSPFLHTAVREAGIDNIHLYERIKDDKPILREYIARALSKSDVLLISGGVSVGEHDYIKDILKESGVEEIFWKIRIKPGKPMFFGVSTETLIFGLPGNPVAVSVLFYELVRPALRALSGEPYKKMVSLPAVLMDSLTKPAGRREFVRANMQNDNGRVTVIPIRKRGSHMVSGMAGADCLIVFPEERTDLSFGEEVQICVLPGFESLCFENSFADNYSDYV